MTSFLRTRPDWPRVLLPASLSNPPRTLEAAREHGAFQGLARAIALGPTATIAEVEASGLRGRGGAGFPTARKWQRLVATQAERRFAPPTPESLRGEQALPIVVVNALGSDEAVATDRALIELNPWALIEGTAIAAISVGAPEAVIVLRGGFVETLRALEDALASAASAGLIDAEPGSTTGAPVRIRIRALRGGAILGEETALIKALEGKRPMPEERPPHPVVAGLFGRPTLVQNASTLASVAWILREGAASFAAIGDPGAPGTALVQVSGALGSGVAEVATGLPLHEIVTLGGGADTSAGATLRGFTIGGFAGAILPAEDLAVPFTFEALRELDAHLGSGAIEAISDRDCVVATAARLARSASEQSCGKSIPCRIGLRRMAEIAGRFESGVAKPGDGALAESLGADIEGSGLCELERLGVNPLRTALRAFPDEFEEHRRGICRAGVCTFAAEEVGAWMA